MKLEVPYTEEEIALLSHCELCPRKCGVNRTKGEKGFCRCGSGIEISAICNHKGEEPILVSDRGICNVFFSHCNLQCVYCQNKQISDNKSVTKTPFYSDETPFQQNKTAFYSDNTAFQKFEMIISKIKQVLSESENTIGFVSPTHQVPLMCAIIRRLHQENIYPKVVYNSNGYDNPQILKRLEGIVDVYLPDFKYSDPNLAKELSLAEDYPQKAAEAISEMYRQKGNSILTDSNDKIESGLIVRHLVLPVQEKNSKGVLDALCDISPNLTVSLMSQYAPIEHMKQDYLNRPLKKEEYDLITDYFFSIGLHKGFFQSLQSQNNLVPDFEKGTWSSKED